jgi:sugar phosphate isomerase/epimerase
LIPPREDLSRHAAGAAAADDIASRISICEYTTFPAPLTADLSAYREAGARGIGLIEAKVRADPAARVRVEESGLVVTNCVTVASSLLPRGDDVDATELHIDRLCDGIRVLARFNPACVYFRLGGFGDLDPLAGRKLACESLRTVAEVGRAAGVPLAIEVVSRTAASFATTIADAVEFLQEAGTGSVVGLVLDTFHLHRIDRWEEDLRAHADRLVAVQIGDRKADELSPWDRAVPGEGTTDLPHMLQVFEELGWRGWYDIEIVSDNGVFGEPLPNSLWELPPAELASRAVAGVRGAWAERPSAQ